MITQKFGVTIELPAAKEVLDTLRYGDVGAHEWNYDGSNLYHKGPNSVQNFPFLGPLNVGETVGILITSSGQLHLYLKGQHHILATELPVNKPLWGAAYMYRSKTRIRSRFLSGEL